MQLVEKVGPPLLNHCHLHTEADEDDEDVEYDDDDDGDDDDDDEYDDDDDHQLVAGIIDLIVELLLLRRQALRCLLHLLYALLHRRHLQVDFEISLTSSMIIIITIVSFIAGTCKSILQSILVSF